MRIPRWIHAIFGDHGDSLERFAIILAVCARVPNAALLTLRVWRREMTPRLIWSMLWPEILIGLTYATPRLVDPLRQGAIYYRRTKYRFSKYWRRRRSERSFSSDSEGGLQETSPEQIHQFQCSLDASFREIRLLYLKPGDERERVQVYTEVVSLLEEPHYFALSYQWGDPSREHPILVDGVELKVPENLFSALKSLRNIAGGIDGPCFWIDALSIQQDNPAERSSQVLLMKEIFRSARKVLVWLTQPSEDSELALAKMRGIEAYLFISTTNPNKKSDAAPLDQDLLETSYLSILPPHGSAERHYEPWQSIYRVFENDWWTRTWIAQEVSSETSSASALGNVEIILGRQLQTVSFRSTLMLMPFIANLLAAQFSTTCPHAEDGYEFHDRFKRVTMRVARLLSVGRLRKEISTTQYIYSLAANKVEREQALWTAKVWPLLHTFRVLKASDAKDKVYAALPLVLPEGHPAFQPDYTLSINQVYAQLVMNFVRYQKRLNILAACNPTASDLPTFIPDWRSPIVTNPLCTLVDTRWLPIYRAAGNTIPTTCMREEPRLQKEGDYKVAYLATRLVLSVKGLKVDTISRVSTHRPNSSRFRRSQWESFLHQLPLRYSPTDESLTSAYQRLLVGDIKSKIVFKLDGFHGSRMQRAAFWLEDVIEAPLRRWLTQAHKQPRSFSVLPMVTGENLQTWETCERGAMVDIGMEFLDSTESATDDSLRDAPADVGTPKSQHHSRVEIPGGGKDRHSAKEGSISANMGNVLAQEANERDMPDSILHWTKDGSREFAVSQLGEIISTVTANRTLCITEKGYIGLVPQHALPTDEVVVLFGGSTPFIIRQVRDEEYESRDENDVRYELVGEAYIHGIMDGEALGHMDEVELEARSEIFDLI